MAIPKNEPTTLLGEALRKRIQTLGISRRELARRSGISKQTIHELEHSGDKGFHEKTLHQLDDALKWDRGTALAYHLGNPKDRDGGIAIGVRVTAYFNSIVKHLATMSVEELEREVIMLDEEAFGRTFQSMDEAAIKYAQLLQKATKQLTETWESLNGNVS